MKISFQRQVFLTYLIVIFACAIVIGASFLVFPSPFAPVFALIALLFICYFFVVLFEPDWLIYLTLFIIFLPVGLLPILFQSYFNRILTITTIFLWIINIVKNRCQVFIPTSTIIFLIFIIWASTSLIWADNLPIALEILQRYILRLALFLIVIINSIKSEKYLNRLMNTLGLIGLFLIITSLITIVSNGYETGSRLKILDVNENALGITLLFTLPAIIWWISKKNKLSSIIQHIFFLFYFFSCVGIIGLSGSRGTFISLVIFLFSLFFWKLTRKYAIFGFIIIVFIIVLIPDVFVTTMARFQGAPGETLLGGREFIWPAGWKMIKENMFIGVGIGNSPYVLPNYFSGFVPINFFSAEIHLHNPILVIWAETGLIGLMLFLSVLVSSLLEFFRNYLQFRLVNNTKMIMYVSVVTSVFFGYMVSWIKGGGLESDYSYFLILSLLILPSNFIIEKVQNNKNGFE